MKSNFQFFLFWIMLLVSSPIALCLVYIPKYFLPLKKKFYNRMCYSLLSKHFSVNFCIHGETQVKFLIFCLQMSDCSSTVCWKHYLSFISSLTFLSKIRYICVDLLLGCLFCSIDLFVPLPVPQLWYVITCLEIEYTNSFHFILRKKCYEL